MTAPAPPRTPAWRRLVALRRGRFCRCRRPLGGRGQ
jgi:hypothetical protein